MNIERFTYKVLNDSSLVDYTYSNFDDTCTSTLDHILTSRSLEKFIEMCDSVDNFSDHVAISCSFSLPVVYVKPVITEYSNVCQWSEADESSVIS